MAQSREARLAKNTLVIALGSFLPRLASFVTLPILTGMLTKEEYGTYDLITVLSSLLIPAVTLQIQAAAFRFLVDARGDEGKQRRIVSNVFALQIPVAIVCLVVLYAVLGHTGASVVRLWICVYYFVDALNNASRQIARGLGNNAAYSVNSLVHAVGSLVLVVIFVYGMNLGLLGATLALLLSTALSLLYLVIRLQIIKLISPGSIDAALLREMLAYSWPLVPNELSNWVIRMSDRLIVTAFLGVAANAVYSVANKIPQIINIAQGAFTLSWQESASIASSDEDATEYYSHMFKTMYALQGGIMGIVVACAPVLFKVLVAGDYDEAYQQLPILCLAIFYASMATFLGGIYVGLKQSKSVGVTTTVAAIINVVLDLALIQFCGIYAASISTLIAYVLLLEYRRRDITKHVAMNYDYKHMLLVNALAIFECALAMPQLTYVNIANFVLASVAFVMLNKETLVRGAAVVRNKLLSKMDK